MASCRMLFRSSLFLSDPWRPFFPNLDSIYTSSCSSSSSSSSPSSSLRFAPLAIPPKISSRARVRVRVRAFHRAVAPLKCSHEEITPPSQPQDDQGPPQEAILKAISEVSKTEGRVAQTTNVVIGGTVTDDSTNEWLALDQKVNSYPTVRGFTAIGTGGDDFVQAMVVAVESVLQQPVPKGRVTQKLSSRGKYVSVKIGPVQVVSSEQVQAVYNAMRRDDRMKYFL